jgi:hypothetical protein
MRVNGREVFEVDSVDVSAIFLCASLAWSPSASNQLLLVTCAVAAGAGGVTSEPWEVLGNAMGVRADHTMRERGCRDVLACHWYGCGKWHGGGHGIGRRSVSCRTCWGNFHILSGCGGSSCCLWQFLSDILRLLDWWRVVGTLRILTPTGWESLTLKRIGLRLNLLCNTSSKGHIRANNSGRGYVSGSSCGG